MSGWTCPPLAIFLAVVIVVLLGWSCWPFIQRKILTYLSLKYRVFLILVLAIIVVVICIVSIGRSQEDMSTPASTPTPTPTSTLTPTPPEEWQWSHPSPQEIFEEVDASPLYLQDDVRQSYEGISVEWGVWLYSVTETTDGMRVSTFSSEKGYRLVVFTVDINEYPQLKIVERGYEIVVQGTITKVDTIGIELGNCQLIFD